MEYFDSHYDGIILQRYCRFGNNIIQLSNAIGVALKYNIPWVNIPGFKYFFEINPDFKVTKIQGIKIFKGNAPSKNVISGRFFHSHDYPDLSDVDFKPILHGIKKNVLGIKKAGFSKDVHVHIRSGDIFERKKPKQNYVQPPLAFYQKAILDQDPKGKVIMVYENNKNPVVDALWGWLKKTGINCRRQSSTLREDVLELMKASVIIGGKGSFVPIITCMTGAKIIVFREISISKTLYDNCGICPEIYIDKSNKYIPVNKWKISTKKGEEHNKQLKQILDYPIENIIRRKNAKN